MVCRWFSAFAKSLFTSLSDQHLFDLDDIDVVEVAVRIVEFDQALVEEAVFCQGLAVQFAADERQFGAVEDGRAVDGGVGQILFGEFVLLSSSRPDVLPI